MKIRPVGSELLQSMAMIMVGFRIFVIALIRTNTNTHRHYTQVSLSYLFIRRNMKQCYNTSGDGISHRA